MSRPSHRRPRAFGIAVQSSAMHQILIERDEFRYARMAREV
jgi:hypothetical protein